MHTVRKVHGETATSKTLGVRPRSGLGHRQSMIYVNHLIARFQKIVQFIVAYKCKFFFAEDQMLASDPVPKIMRSRFFVLNMVELPFSTDQYDNNTKLICTSQVPPPTEGQIGRACPSIFLHDL